MKTALGKGLEALIPKSGLEAVELDIERVVPSEGQPRKRFEEGALKELAASIKEKGILQPLVVCPAGDGSFRLIAGERRLRAAHIAGLRKVPAILKKAAAPADCLEMALIENIQREDLNPMETARAMDKLQVEFKLTQEALSEKLGKERATVANFLRLLKLPEEVQGCIQEEKLSMGHAKVLLGFETQARMIEAAHTAIKDKLSVRELEKLLKKNTMGTGREAVRRAALRMKDPNILALEERLKQTLGAKVKIKHKGKKGGRIEIEYSSVDELQGILERMG